MALTKKPSTITVRRLMKQIVDDDRKAKALADKVAEAKAELLALLEAQGDDRYEYPVVADKHTITAVVVKGKRAEIDWTAVRDELPADVWEAVSTRTLDTRKMEAAIAEGKVDGGMVASHTEDKPIKPYVKVTVK